ncbi:uncharacterized protein LOC114288120 isoform X2 [Camellia sinensis]|uniref:uncharacterized protein LOC114288120 isoform X2 n=1 Tax=Camellia sinensis TaxID=4442 RepID=UPI001035E725|nr:uncharacterized protein LOC114288120 isoform X2 [Camellia sinensis]
MDSRKYTGIVEDCCCDYETIDSFNGEVLHPLLQELVTTPFFRYFKLLEWNEEQTEEQGGAESPPVVANDPCAQSSGKKEDNPVNGTEESGWGQTSVTKVRSKFLW